MKSKFKILSLILALAISTSMFTGCKKKTTETTPGTPDKPTNISWYIWGPKPNKPDDVIKALNEKSAKDIGVTVDFKWQPNDESLRTALASGDKDIDIAYVCSWFADYVGSSQKKFLMDITDKIEKDTPKLYKALPETLWDCMRVNGKIYGVPTWKDTAATMYWLGRKDILEKAGATEDFKKAGRALADITPTLTKVKAWHDKDPAKNLYSEGNTAPINFSKTGMDNFPFGWDVFQYDVKVGVKIGSKNETTVMSMLTEEETVAGFKTLKEWADKGLSNGKSALQVETNYPLTTIGSAQGWDGAEFTSWGGPTKGYDTLISKLAGPFLTTSYVQGSANCIGANSKKADAALKYLEYVNTDATYRNMIGYGVEGKNWEKTGDGQMKTLSGSDWLPGNFTLGSFELLIPEYPAPKDTYTKLVDQVNTATPSPVLGFVPNTQKIQNQIAACTSILTEYFPKLACGAVGDVDATLKELMGKLDAQGYQEIIKEYQNQVDEFLKTNKK